MAKTKTEKKTKAKTKTPTATTTVGIDQRQYALRQLYAGLREMGHTPMVAAAMMNSVSSGMELFEIEDAAKTYGDL